MLERKMNNDFSLINLILLIVIAVIIWNKFVKPSIDNNKNSQSPKNIYSPRLSKLNQDPSNPPYIKIGMEIGEVINVLGENYESSSGNDILSKKRSSGKLIVSGNSNQFSETTYYVFNHPAGKYLIAARNGIVTEIGGQPSGKED